MIIPMSAEEHSAHRDRRIPAAERVAEGVWTLPLRNHPGHMSFTFSYLVEDAEGGVHVIDPGWDLDENLEAIRAALARTGRRGRGPASIIVTHLHPDHMGLAERLRSGHGSPVVLHRWDEEAQRESAHWLADAGRVRADLVAWGVPSERLEEVLGYVTGTPRVVIPADLHLEDGDLLPVPGRRLRAVHTPGHTPGHLCLLEEDQRLLFTGDHLLPVVTPGVGAAGHSAENPLRLYLDNLLTVRAYDDCQSLPGHEFRYRGIAARAAGIAARHLRRTVEVEAVLAVDPGATTWAVASRLSWSRGWAGLTRHYLVSALRQTAMHADLVRSGAHLDALEAWGRPPVGPRPLGT
ncbi:MULTISPECIES: MBL fold metallo-hydrolase [Citricoccus]|uniref:MBL fold metallo-hydrolase n=1 Tax=Citricoccus TaxID=169133 RepID=UPI000255F26A|nr:MBL fold metallo-hydrolase [Citricoccus sp. CH26A]